MLEEEVGVTEREREREREIERVEGGGWCERELREEVGVRES